MPSNTPSPHDYHIPVSTLQLAWHLEEQHGVPKGTHGSASNFGELVAAHEAMHPEVEERRQAERERWAAAQEAGDA